MVTMWILPGPALLAHNLPCNEPESQHIATSNCTTSTPSSAMLTYFQMLWSIFMITDLKNALVPRSATADLTSLRLVSAEMPPLRVSTNRFPVCGGCVRWPLCQFPILASARSRDNTIPLESDASNAACAQLRLRTASRNDILFACVCLQPVTAEQHHART